MTQTTLPEYSKITSSFQSDNLAVTPAEIQGFLSGMLCGGLNIEQDSWALLLYDYTNEGKAWPLTSNTLAENCLNIAHSQFSSSKMDFQLLLPDKNASLADRAQALSDWTNAFIVGMGLVGVKEQKISTEAQDILKDLSEIAQLGIDEDENIEDQTVFLDEVTEYVRVCAMTLFLKPNAEDQGKPTLH